MADSKTSEEEALQYAESIINTIHEPLIILNHDLRVVSASRSFYDLFKVAPEKTVGQLIYDLGNKQWDIPELRQLLENILPRKTTLDDYEVEHEFAGIGRRTMLLNAREIQRDPGKQRLILLAIEDITERKRMEEGLRESEERYRLLVETSNDIVWIFDLSSMRYTYCSKSVETILGYSQEEANNFKLDDLHPPETKKKVVAAFDQVFKGKSNSDQVIIEAQHRHKNGSLVWMEISAMLHRDNQGQPVSFTGVSRDITEHKQAEEALKEQSRALNERNKELSCLYGISRLVEDQGDSIDDILQGTVNLLPNSWQYPEAACARIKFEDRVYVSGNFCETSWRQAQDIIAEKELVGCVEIFYLEEKPQVHEGPFIREERDLIDDVAERLGHIIGRVRAQTRLRRSEQKFRDIFNGSNDAVFIHDISGRFLEVNQVACSRLGYSCEELLYMTPMDLDADEFAGSGPQRIQDIDQQGSLVFESVHRCKDGSTVDVEISSRKIDYEGKSCILSIARDITERKQAEQERDRLQAQLAQAQKLESVGRLAGGVAHDFNNKLSIINGYAEMSFDMVDPEDPVYGNLKEIYNAGKRSEDIVRQLLAFARQQTVSPVRLDLNDTISNMLKMLQRLIGENIDLAWHPGNNLWPVKIDPSQLDQLLANLAVNARDAISDVGKMTIETKNVVIDEDYCRQYTYFVPGEYVMLAVSDNGCGMEKEVQDNLFEPFFTTKESGKGTGLGLSTVYGIVKQNNGFINVYSEPGEGTIFKIYLPRHEEQESPASEHLKEFAEQRPTGSETILLVEDERSVLHMGRVLLEKLGYTVLTAEAPDDALQLAEEYAGRIQLLITDVIMPEMNGRDLAMRINLLRPETKTIYISSYTESVIAHLGVLDKGVHYIQKPFSIQALAVKVREVIEQE